MLWENVPGQILQKTNPTILRLGEEAATTLYSIKRGENKVTAIIASPVPAPSAPLMEEDVATAAIHTTFSFFSPAVESSNIGGKTIQTTAVMKLTEVINLKKVEIIAQKGYLTFGHADTRNTFMQNCLTVYTVQLQSIDIQGPQLVATETQLEQLFGKNHGLAQYNFDAAKEEIFSAAIKEAIEIKNNGEDANGKGEKDRKWFKFSEKIINHIEELERFQMYKELHGFFEIGPDKTTRLFTKPSKAETCMLKLAQALPKPVIAQENNASLEVKM